MDVLYLCNGKRCPDTYHCKVRHPKLGYCNHTMNVEPERFMMCRKDTNDELYFEEREVCS